MTVALLAQMYLAHARKEFNGRHGHKEVATIRHAFGPLVLLYGECGPGEIGPLELRASRHYWVQQRNARTTIQARMQRLRKAWRWARQVGLIETDLPDIGHLRYGHAPEPEPIKPVDLELVEATLPHLSKTARALIRLLMYTGMRPGEACTLTADAVDTASNPWVYRPKHHKQAWRGIKREIYLGPRAQMLLQPRLTSVGVAVPRNDATASMCFVPAAIGVPGTVTAGPIFNTNRGAPLGPKAQMLLLPHLNNAGAVMAITESADARLHPARDVIVAIDAAIAMTTRAIFKTARGQPWKPTSLYMAVWNATRRHGLAHWHPNQIRHAVATSLRKELGLDAAQAVLGHARIETTQVYSLRQNELAAQAALKFG